MARERNTPSQALNWMHANCGVASPGECLQMPFSTGSHGYCGVSIKHKKILAHRYVCEKFHGAPPSSLHQAAHSCGNKTCVNPHHLRWATRRENEADKKLHGTAAVGARNGSAKLTPALAKEIKKTVGSHRAIAKTYGISASSVGRIKSGEAWSSNG